MATPRPNHIIEKDQADRILACPRFSIVINSEEGRVKLVVRQAFNRGADPRCEREFALESFESLPGENKDLTMCRIVSSLVGGGRTSYPRERTA